MAKKKAAKKAAKKLAIVNEPIACLNPDVPDFATSEVASVKQLFAYMVDQRISYTFRRHELAEIAEFYGIDVGSRIRENLITSQIRNIVTCRTCCSGEEPALLNETRWMRVDEGVPIKVGLDPVIARAYGSWFIEAADWLLDQINSDKLILDIAPAATFPGGIPDVYVGSQAIDGALKTLAATYRVEKGALDSGQPPYAAIMYDNAENWQRARFIYVTAHELGHMLGVGHGPLRNLMYESVPHGDNLIYGDWDKTEFGLRIPPTAPVTA